MCKIKFIDKNGTFVAQECENLSNLYFPLASEVGLKSSITPNLGGDSKIDQNHFLLEPVSIENLHNNRSTRNFWCCIDGKGTWSATGVSARQEAEKFTKAQDKNCVQAGMMWHTTKRYSENFRLESEITTFVPVDGNVEVMKVELTNLSENDMEITPIAAIPVYGRSADNLRDHRHVTSLLHRIQTTENGVVTTPVLSFDERGHQKNSTSYGVYGFTGEGEHPESFYPTVEEFIGGGGSFLNPEAVRELSPGRKSGETIQGKEAMGGIRFEKTRLLAGESRTYIVLAGVSISEEQMQALSSTEKVDTVLQETKDYWIKKVNVEFSLADENTEGVLKWICFQPILRRIFGCSFLPYHDYGKGGRGWRDLWQDCLALLIMDPSRVRSMILSNYGGVRIDGTNATIIGEKQGQFIADRNSITRVWMDHAYWPFVTTKFYIDQTGDISILLEKACYFKDAQSLRGTDHDTKWSLADGEFQKTENGHVYKGTIIEHILLENLCAFYDVGEHNHMRLRGADWNDALDMASERGESVAFTAAYAGNLKQIADILLEIASLPNGESITIAEEMGILLESGADLYNDICEKQNLLVRYMQTCDHTVSGNQISVNTLELKANLEEKADWIMEHIRETEWVKGKEKQGWFNGYYDNHGNQVESYHNGNARMMLTSQVFSIMSGTAKPDQIRMICESADSYLYEKKAGGYRLNTDFKEEKFDLGRMFGFAYGEKENGTVFSHMTVMYANALYKRGFVKEGYKALKTLLDTAMQTRQSCIYPGLPEYFDAQGKGLYPYLTGAASWYMLTMVTEVFGVFGELGKLCVSPKLLAEQFDETGRAEITLEFADKKFKIVVFNPEKKEYGSYRILKADLDGEELKLDKYEKEMHMNKVQLEREVIEKLSADKRHQIIVQIG